MHTALEKASSEVLDHVGAVVRSSPVYGDQLRCGKSVKGKLALFGSPMVELVILILRHQ